MPATLAHDRFSAAFGSGRGVASPSDVVRADDDARRGLRRHLDGAEVNARILSRYAVPAERDRPANWQERERPEPEVQALIDRLVGLARAGEYDEPVATLWVAGPSCWVNPDVADVDYAVRQCLHRDALAAWTTHAVELLERQFAMTFHRKRDGAFDGIYGNCYDGDDYGRFFSETMNAVARVMAVAFGHGAHPPQTGDVPERAPTVAWAAEVVRPHMLRSLSGRFARGIDRLIEQLLDDRTQARFLDEKGRWALRNRVGGNHMLLALDALIPDTPRALSDIELDRRMLSFTAHLEWVAEARIADQDPYTDEQLAPFKGRQ